MRCELAACLLHDPEILFLDEPTIGLDLVAKQRFRELLVRLNEQQGTTIFLTSHDVADIEHVAERAIVINHGEVIYDDEVAAMRRALLATKIVEVGLGGADRRARRTPASPLLEHTRPAHAARGRHARRRRSARCSTTLLDGPAVADISVVDPPLEQVIAEIYELPRPMTRRALDRGGAAASAQRVARRRAAGSVVAVGFYVVDRRRAVRAVAGGRRRQRRRPRRLHAPSPSPGTSSRPRRRSCRVNARLIEDIGDDIAQGAVAVELLRPASVLGVRVATEVGRGLPQAGVAAGVAGVVAGHGRRRRAAAARRRSLLAAPSLVLAITANLVAQHAVAAAAFWIRDAGSVWFLYLKAVFILGGMIIPLELLPDGLRARRAVPAVPGHGLRAGPPGVRAREPVLLLEQVGWLGVLAVVAAARVPRRRAPAAGGRRMRGSAATVPQRRSPRWRPSRGALAVADGRDGRQRLRVGRVLGAVLRPGRHPRRLGPRHASSLLQAVLTTAGGLSLGVLRQRPPHRDDGRRRRPRRRARAAGRAAAATCSCAASSR